MRTGRACLLLCIVAHGVGTAAAQPEPEPPPPPPPPAIHCDEAIPHTTKRAAPAVPKPKGDTCSYECDNGYADSGSGSVTCRAGGQFTAGSWTAKSCADETIQHTAGGSTTCQGATGDPPCSYTCAAGYEDSGSGSVRCKANGQFSAGGCSAKSCAGKTIQHTNGNGGSTTCEGVTGDPPCSYRSHCSCQQGGGC